MPKPDHPHSNLWQCHGIWVTQDSTPRGISELPARGHQMAALITAIASLITALTGLVALLLYRA